MKQHAILNNQSIMEEKGIVVFNKIPNLLMNGETFTFPGLIVCVNMVGWFKVNYDMRPLEFHSHDIAVLLPNHIISVLDASIDSRTMTIMISQDLFHEIKRDSPNIYHDGMEYHWNPHFHLNEDQYICITNLLTAVEHMVKTVRLARKDAFKQIVNVLLLMLREYRITNGNAPHSLTNQEILFANFYEAITKHYRESREVRFYADKFCLTPKYFSIKIKRLTGVNALDWINNYVMIQAKRILRTHKEYSIQQIAYYLGFSDQSSFSRFFKQESGVSPKEFREHYTMDVLY